MGFFDKNSMFGIDFNGDGKADMLDDLLFMDMMETEERQRREEDDLDDEEEEELLDALEDMDADERREAMEDAGLDPDDFDEF